MEDQLTFPNPVRESLRARAVVTKIWPYLLVVLVVVVALLKIFGLRGFNPAYPIQPLSGDGYLSLYVAKALGENALLHNPRVGAPLGLDYYDFYQPDYLHQAILKCLDLITGQAMLAVNLYWLGSFVLIALAAFYVFRRFHLSVGVSLVCAVLYAFTPSHLMRSFNHLFLSAYYVVPFAGMVALQIMFERTLRLKAVLGSSDKEQRTTRDRSKLIRFLWFTIPLAIVLGGSGVYYAFFSMLFIGAAGCYAILRQRNWVYGMTGLACAAIIGLSTGAAMLPKAIYEMRAGSSAQVADRNPVEESVYSLKIAELFLPNPEHRIAKLRAISQDYINTFPALNANEGEWSNLGVVGSLGLAALLLWPFLRVSRDQYDQLMKFILILTLVGLLFTTTEGFGALFSQFITAKLRCQTRVVFFIAFFALFAFGIVVEKLIQRLPPKPAFQVPVAIGLGLILVCGLYDESFAELHVPHQPLKAAFQREDRFFQQIESVSPVSGMVLELPYQGFPEVPGVNNTDPYDDLRGYIHSKKLRWSFPTMRGRPDDEWIQNLDANPTPILIRNAALAGFCGIYVERQGFKDGAAAFESELRSLTQAQPIVSPDGQLSFYSLTRYTQALQRATKPDEWARLVHQVRPNLVLTMVSGIYGQETDRNRSWRWCNQKGAFEIVNATGHEQKADLTGSLTGWSSQKASVWFTTFNKTIRVPLRSEGNKFDVPVVLKPGDNRISFRTDSPRAPAPNDSREMYFQLSGVELVEH